MPQTNLALLLKVFSVAFEFPTTSTADAVVSGTLRSDTKTLWEALQLPSESIERFSEALNRYVDRDQEDVLHELRREYTRLFLGDNPLVANSEGMWRMKSEGRKAVLIINSYSLEIADFMRECGVVKAEGYNDCIDYVDTEFDFASHLAGSPEYLVDLGKDPLDLFDSFIDNHLELWIPGFCNDVLNTSDVVYYKAISALISEFIDEL